MEYFSRNLVLLFIFALMFAIAGGVKAEGNTPVEPTEVFADLSPITYHTGYIPGTSKSSIEVKWTMDDNDRRLFSLPVLLIEYDSFADEVAAKCSGRNSDNKFASVKINFQVWSDEIEASLLEQVNKAKQRKPEKAFTSFHAQRYRMLELRALIQSEDSNLWREIELATYPRRTASNPDPRNGSTLTKYPHSFGTDESIRLNCADLIALSESGKFELKIWTTAKLAKINSIIVNQDYFSRSDAFIELNREESQSGSIFTNLHSKSKSRGIGISFGSSSGSGANNESVVNTTVTDSRQRYVTARAIQNAVYKYYDSRNMLISESFEDDRYNIIDIAQSLFERITAALGEPISADIDIGNRQIVLNSLNRASFSSADEKLLVQPVGSLSSTVDKKAVNNVSGGKAGAQTKVDTNNSLNTVYQDSRGVKYENNGSGYVPTSIDLYALDKAAFDRIENADFSHLRTFALSSLVPYPVEAQPRGTSSSAIAYTDRKIENFKNESIAAIDTRITEQNGLFQKILDQLKANQPMVEFGSFDSPNKFQLEGNCNPCNQALADKFCKSVKFSKAVYWKQGSSTVKRNNHNYNYNHLGWALCQ